MAEDTNLPEPANNHWNGPPCPHCGNTNTWLWHPRGTLRWYCYVCMRRFDLPVKRKESKTRDLLLKRDSEKFPLLAAKLANPTAS